MVGAGQVRAMNRIAGGHRDPHLQHEPRGGGPAVGGHEVHGQIQPPTTDIKLRSPKVLLETSGQSRQFATLFARARRRLPPTTSASGRANR